MNWHAENGQLLCHIFFFCYERVKYKFRVLHCPEAIDFRFACTRVAKYTRFTIPSFLPFLPSLNFIRGAKRDGKSSSYEGKWKADEKHVLHFFNLCEGQKIEGDKKKKGK